MQKGVTRFGTIPKKSIWHLIGMHKPSLSIFGIKLKVGGVKFGVHHRDHGTCKHCGLVGTFFGVEKHRDSIGLHLNLYGILDGVEVLLTLDHIVPVTDGGHKTMSNGQCLCERCNVAKSNCVKHLGKPCTCNFCAPEIHKIRSLQGKRYKVAPTPIKDTDEWNKLDMSLFAGEMTHTGFYRDSLVK